jgi:hypothetical protein
VHGELGERDAAVAAYTRATNLHAAPPAEVPEIAAALARWQGHAETALQMLATHTREPLAPTAKWWQRYGHGRCLFELGRVQRQLGQLRAARDSLEIGVAELSVIESGHAQAAYERRLGRARAELALTLAALGAPASRIAPLAAASAEWLRQAEGNSEEIAALARLAAAK